MNDFLLLNIMNNKNHRLLDFYCFGICGLIYYNYPIIQKFLLKNIFERNFYRSNVINIIGWEFLETGRYFFDYPLNMIAINNYVFINNKAKNYIYFNIEINGKRYHMEDIRQNSDLNDNYLLNEVYNLCIYDDIYLTIVKNEIDLSSNNIKSFSYKILMSLTSYNHDQKYIDNFINKCIIDYENINKNKYKDKTYHFIYQGLNNKEEPNFSTKLISDFNNPKYQNYESFDNLFHKYKDSLIRDIERLKDVEYYREKGLKRKKGYLFHGPPGCGKTSTVMAISNYDRRHIIEIPLSRVKTNNEFEKILNISEINSIKLNNNNVIILFDELDIGTSLNRDIPIPNIDNLNKSKNDSDISPNIDKLSLNTILSRLDGIGNYNGLIIIGTTNNIDYIDKSLYRDGRLNLMNFEYASYNDIINIIEKYYKVKLNSEQLNDIKKIKEISHSKLICKLEEYDFDDFGNLILSLI